MKPSAQQPALVLAYAVPLTATEADAIKSLGIKLPAPLVTTQQDGKGGHAADKSIAVPPLQGEIAAALTKQPLNERQTAVLEIYAEAWRDQEGPLPVAEIAKRLVAKDLATADRASDFVKGALRSFGKRLLQTLSKPVLKIGKDHMGDGVVDNIPLLALFHVSKGSTGETCHQLTEDGAAAVALALGMTSAGKAASSPLADHDDPDEMVAVAMKRSSYALLLRVQNGMGGGLDDAVRHSTAMAGAG
jgi:hypothetical protein